MSKVVGEGTGRVQSAWGQLCAGLEPGRWRAGGADPAQPAASAAVALAGQPELAAALARLLTGAGPADAMQPGRWSVRHWPGDADRARPATLRLRQRDRSGQGAAIVVRLRALPRNLYRAAGFALKLEADCRVLRRELEAGRAAAGFVCFVDGVGVISPERAAGWRRRYPPVAVLGWSARWGRLD